MKKFLFLVALAFVPSLVFAHPGNTDSLGGHTCWTNCASWGYSYGQYHFHNSYVPYFPVERNYDTEIKIKTDQMNSERAGFARSGSIFGNLNTDTGTNRLAKLQRELEQIKKDKFEHDAKEKYKKEHPLANSCTFNSHYDESVKACECNVGYTPDSSGLFCVKDSNNNYECKQKHGNPAFYDTSIYDCSCKKGFVMNDNMMCEEGGSWCVKTYGGGDKNRAYYSKTDDFCYSCPEGYRIDSKANKCVSINYKAPAGGNYVVVKDLKVYEKMNGTSKVLTSFKKGDKVQVIRSTNGWAQVKLANEKFGYVFRNKINSI